MRQISLVLISLLTVSMLPACSQGTEALNETPAPEAVEESKTSVQEQSELVGRGEAIAEGACASCHAIGGAGTSPHPAAPPFRMIGRSVPIDSLREGFAEGFIAGHPDMPEWQLEQNDIDGLLAYLKSVQVLDTD